MTTVQHFSCHIIRQKSTAVVLRGPVCYTLNDNSQCYSVVILMVFKETAFTLTSNEFLWCFISLHWRIV